MFRSFLCLKDLLKKLLTKMAIGCEYSMLIYSGFKLSVKPQKC